MNVDEVLAKMDAPDANEEEIQYIIDENLRVISIPPLGVVLGVEGDKDVNSVKFKMVRYYKGIDLSKFEIRINFANANGDLSYYTVKNPTVTDDTLTFEWLVGYLVTKYKGTVRFVVRMIITDSSTGEVQQAFDTTIGKAQSLEGLLVDVPTDEKVYDIVAQLKADLTDHVNNLLKTIPEDYNELTKKVGNNALGISELKEDIGAITGNKKIIGWSERKKYLNTAVSTVNVNNPVSTELNYRYVVIPCVEGDIFTINGESGPETRLWCFTDETYNVLTKSDGNATASNLEVIAPYKSAYLILNDKTDTVSYVGRLLHICVKRNNEAVTQIQNKLEDFNDITEISKFIAHVDKRNLLNNASVRENIAYNNWMPNTMYDTRNLDGWYSIPIIPVEAGKQYCFTHNNKKNSSSKVFITIINMVILQERLLRLLEFIQYPINAVILHCHEKTVLLDGISENTLMGWITHLLSTNRKIILYTQKMRLTKLLNLSFQCQHIIFRKMVLT